MEIDSNIPPPTPAPPKDPILSSSPAFATPVAPIQRTTTRSLPLANPPRPTVLPILLPPPILRPHAVRVLTKKHGLNVQTSALQALATFIGRHCGTGWREEGLGEQVLEEVARMWKKSSGDVIVKDEGDSLKGILKSLEACMSGGKVVQRGGLSRQGSLQTETSRAGIGDRQESFGMSSLGVEDEEQDESRDPRAWLKVIGAFEQPRLAYNTTKKHFEHTQTPPSLFPPPSHKTELFRQRYNLIHARLLRNESFQPPTLENQPRHKLSRSDSSLTQNYTITPIANLLGRSGTSHLLLGLITRAPTGGLLLTDLSGGINLNLQHTQPTVGVDGAWFCPGMIVLVDGVYEEDAQAYGATGTTSGALGDIGGVGGTIGGRFVAFSIAHPPAERRNATLGITDSTDSAAATHGGFGWMDFLGVGSERAVGTRMRRVQQRCFDMDAPHSGNKKVVVLGEVELDVPRSLQALRKILSSYADLEPSEMPISFILTGNFVKYAALAGGSSGGSIEYKECFDALASVLGDFPQLLRHATFVFVPGDNDPWASAFSAGAATPLPRQSIPGLFTSRVRRAFAEANREGEKSKDRIKVEGQAIWTSNPTRVSMFGPNEEIVIFRDDISGRFRRTGLRFGAKEEEHDNSAQPDEGQAAQIEDAMEVEQLSEAPLPVVDTLSPSVISTRKLVRTILDQSHLSPFPLSIRPVLWDYASSLSLYPLPSTLILADPEAPAFALTYEGCHVMNPGRLVREGRGKTAGWVEYDVTTRKGDVKEIAF
ncbi:MAG: DNA-directed DNA polymerase epsilon, subunit B [Bogoriella megaspora]|nr:MAG: DNA-directed DNA polymerase epsilon, subunit B [Bogoriella megaspora]